MKIVIIGQSPAVVAAIRKLREDNNGEEITLISADGHLPYDRGLFPGLIGRKVREKEIFCVSEDFYAKNNVRLVLDRAISRINLQRRRIFLTAPSGEAQGEKMTVDFDALIMADAPQVRLPDLKGIRRTGVFHLARFESVHKLVRYLPLMETAVVVPVSLQGIAAALALKEAGKDVIILAAGDRLLGSCLDVRLSALLAGLLEKRGLRIVMNTAPADVLGEVEMKAIRTSSGKILAAEMVVFENVIPDLRPLEDSGLVFGERIPVMATMQTNIPGVFAVDAMMEMESPKMTGGYDMSLHAAMLQGETAALAVRGLTASFAAEPEDLRTRIEALFTAEEICACQEGLGLAIAEASPGCADSLAEQTSITTEGA